MCVDCRRFSSQKPSKQIMFLNSEFKLNRFTLHRHRIIVMSPSSMADLTPTPLTLSGVTQRFPQNPLAKRDYQRNLRLLQLSEEYRLEHFLLPTTVPCTRNKSTPPAKGARRPPRRPPSYSDRTCKRSKTTTTRPTLVWTRDAEPSNRGDGSMTSHATSVSATARYYTTRRERYKAYEWPRF